MGNLEQRRQWAVQPRLVGTKNNVLSAIILSSSLSLVGAGAHAAPMLGYNSGNLDFQTTNKSIWGENLPAALADSKFYGADWTNKTASLGGIIGSQTSTTVNTNPLWWAWKACKETVNIFCGDQPSKGAVKAVIDTRTGAKVDLTTSGKFGFEVGYEVDAGSIDADVQFQALADLPGEAIGGGESINLNTQSFLSDGLISTQSPTAKAYVNAIAELSANITAKGCLIALGCKEGSAQLANFKESLSLLEVNPNAIEILPEALPPKNPGEDREPLLKANLFNQTLTLQASVDVTGAPGFKLATDFGTLVDTTPTGAPSVEVDLATLEFKVPEIQATGGVQGQSVKAEGRDDFLKLKADIDGIAALAGVLPPLGVGVSLVDIGSGATNFKIAGTLDVLDVKMGPDLGFAQDFELKPTLWSSIAFSSPVMIAGAMVNSWTGIWNQLPAITLFKTTTFSPTYWVDVLLDHKLALDLGLSGTLDLFKVGLNASLGGVKLLGGDISLNQILGLGNKLFDTPKVELPIWMKEFALTGFNQVAGAAFTVRVPAPSTWLLMLLGLGLILSRGSRRMQRSP